MIECSLRHLGWLNLLLIRLGIWGYISKSNTICPFRHFVNHMNIGFIPFVASCLLHLLFYHRIQSLRIDYFLASNTHVNTVPNRNQACEVSDLGTDHLLIGRRLKVIDEALGLLAHATFRHTHRKIPHFSFLSPEERCNRSYLSVKRCNTPRMHWPSLSS